MAANWDNLNIGHPELDHSERFFEKRHLEHERMGALALKKILMAEQEKANAIVAAKNKKNAEKNLVDVVEDTVHEMKRLAVGKKALTTTNRFTKPPPPKPEPKKVQPVQAKPLVKPFKARPLPKYLRDKKENKENAPSVPATKQTRPPPAPPAKAATKPPLKRPAMKSTAAPRPVAEVAPRVKFNVVEPRSARKTMPTRPSALRIFTSAPAVPSRISNARRTFAIPETRPKTAPTEQPKQFTAKVPSYLYKEPFKVSHDRKPIDVKPFSLVSRVDSRQKSDEARRKAIVAKHKQAEEAKLKKEQEEWKNLRKQREFKARANPFNKVVVKKTKVDEAVKAVDK